MRAGGDRTSLDTARAHRNHASKIRSQARSMRARVVAVRAVAQANRDEASSARTLAAAKARHFEAQLAEQLVQVLSSELATLETEAARADSAALAAAARGTRHLRADVSGVERTATRTRRRPLVGSLP